MKTSETNEFNGDIDTIGHCANCGVEFHIHKINISSMEEKHPLTELTQLPEIVALCETNERVKLLVDQSVFFNVMDGVHLEEQKEIEYNKGFCDGLGKNAWKDFCEMTDGDSWVGKITIVEKPRGTNNHESFGVFKDIHVSQYSVGDGGDSFAGQLYAKAGKRWIEIQYEC